MIRLTLASILSAIVLPQIALAETPSSTSSRVVGDASVETSIGLAAGYGIFGVAAHYAISDRTTIGLSGGVDIYNTHVGIRTTSYFSKGKWSPLAYLAISRSQFESEQSWYASVGAGIEYLSDLGLYWQGSAGYTAYLSGHAGEGNGPGFFEMRPLTIGFRF